MRSPVDDVPTGTILHLRVRSRMVSEADAACYLGIPKRRLKLLRIAGTGPSLQTTGKKPTFRIEDLDTYCSALYEKAGLSAMEHARHRQILVAMHEEKNGSETHPEQTLPFMMLATQADLISHGIFFVLKAMALFGLIMLCISSSPLLKTHFG